ncbi:MAG: hypothetical protein WC781_00285 [Candidatus Pacearchaeota archaeon]|jgi:hypothetical protein
MENQNYQTENEADYVSLDFNPIMRKAVDHFYRKHLVLNEKAEEK